MAKVAKTESEIVRENLIAFRNFAELSAAEAAEYADVPIDSLRKYESGVTKKVPATVLAALSKIYGHPMEDFMMENPPPARLEDRPIYNLRTRPGAVVNQNLHEKILKLIAEAESDAKKKTQRR